MKTVSSTSASHATHLAAQSALAAANLQIALGGAGAPWIRAAMTHAESDPLAAALAASALATALALRAAQHLDREMRERALTSLPDDFAGWAVP